MKKLFVISLAVALLATASAAMAAINGSRHDMGAMAINSMVGSYGDCSACHLPHKAKGAKLWSVPPPTTYHASYATVGLLCARCHDGVTIQTTSADMAYTIYKNKAAASTGLMGHKMAAGQFPDQPGGVADDLTASSLPYTGADKPALTVGYIECTSCHDVHNSLSNRPFVATNGLTALCVGCHNGRENASAVGSGNTDGLHPTGLGFATGNGTTGGNSPVTTAAMASVSSGTGISTDPAAWNSGSHVLSATLDCVSCHMVHGDEPDVYTEDGDAANTYEVGSGTYDSALLFTTQITDAGGGDYHNAFCEACHQGDSQNAVSNPAGSYPNPGDTPAGTAGANADAARTWHPANAGEENGTGRLVPITEPTGYVFGINAGGDVVCTSCHSAHGADGAGTNNFANTPALRTDGANSFCQACHDPDTGANVNFDCFHAGHMLGGGGSTATGMTLPPNGINWGGATSQGLDCGLCHGAHNTSYVPILKAPGPAAATSPDAICVTCHTKNPSAFTTAGDAARAATHFLGNPLTAGAVGADWTTPAGYGVANYTIVPEKLNNDDWSQTTASSIYGGTIVSNRGEMTCLSCHTTKKNCGDTTGVNTTGDADGTYMMLAASGNTIDISGFATTQGTPDTYLCTGCHGYPDALTKIDGSETGTTHPTGEVATGIYPGTQGLSKTADGTMNCESCHRAHDADTNSGTYILEGGTTGAFVTGSGTATSARPSHVHEAFCSGCHSAY